MNKIPECYDSTRVFYFAYYTQGQALALLDASKVRAVTGVNFDKLTLGDE